MAVVFSSTARVPGICAAALVSAVQHDERFCVVESTKCGMSRVPLVKPSVALQYFDVPRRMSFAGTLGELRAVARAPCPGRNAHAAVNLPTLILPVFAACFHACSLCQYEESLLEMRRVLHACILHAPSNVDAFWAAAAVEGGVSPDPGDVSESSHEAESAGASAPRKLALSEELVRVLGLADLDLREEDLPMLGDM